MQYMDKQGILYPIITKDRLILSFLTGADMNEACKFSFAHPNDRVSYGYQAPFFRF